MSILRSRNTSDADHTVFTTTAGLGAAATRTTSFVIVQATAYPDCTLHRESLTPPYLCLIMHLIRKKSLRPKIRQLTISTGCGGLTGIRWLKETFEITNGSEKKPTAMIWKAKIPIEPTTDKRERGRRLAGFQASGCCIQRQSTQEQIQYSLRVFVGFSCVRQLDTYGAGFRFVRNSINDRMCPKLSRIGCDPIRERHRRGLENSGDGGPTADSLSTYGHFSKPQG